MNSKIILITGATGALGAKAAHVFAAQGHSLVLIDTPKSWPQSGFQLVAAHIAQGHAGGWQVSPSQDTRRTAPSTPITERQSTSLRTSPAS